MAKSAGKEDPIFNGAVVGNQLLDTIKLREYPKALSTKQAMKVVCGQVNYLGMVITTMILQWTIRSQLLRYIGTMEAVQRLDVGGHIECLRYSPTPVERLNW